MRFVPDDLPPTPLGTAYEDLPERIERVCCYGKSCGFTDLRRDRRAVIGADGTPQVIYGYVRIGNEDEYFSARTVDGLIEQMNDTKRWRGRWVPESIRDAEACVARSARELGIAGAWLYGLAATVEHDDEHWRVTPNQPEKDPLTPEVLRPPLPDFLVHKGTGEARPLAAGEGPVSGQDI